MEISVNTTAPARKRRRTAVALCSATGLLLAACGGGDDTNSATPEVVIDGVAEAADGDQAAAGDGAADDGVATENGGGAESADATDEELALAFAQCMRDEGVDWPDPVTNADGSIDLFGGQGPPAGGGDGEGGRDEARQAAFQACGSIVEGASFLPGRGEIDAEAQDTLLEFAQCLRDNGLDVDDPDFENFGPGGGGGGGGGGLFGEGFNPQDPAVQPVIEECQSLFAGGDFAPGGGRGGPGGGAGN